MKPPRNLQLVAAAIGLATLTAHADEPSKAPDRRELWVPVSELKTVLAQHPRAVLLSREQYEALMRDAKKVLEPGEEPPVRAVLASAHYNGELSGDVIDVQAEFTVNVLSDNWAEVPLRLGDLALGDIKLDGDAAFSADGDATKLMIHGKGAHKITAEFMLPVKKDSGVNSVQLSLPRAGAGLFTFNVPPDTEVESSQPVDLKKNAGSTTVSLALAAQNDVVVSWHGTGNIQQSSAILFQENSYIYSIDETRVEADLGIVLNSALGSLPGSLQIKIPAGSTPLQVLGSEVLKWTATGDLLTVDLTPGDRKTAGIRVLLETPSKLAPDVTQLPLPEIAGVRRSGGKFAVIGSRGVKIKEIAAGDGAVQAEGIFDSSIEQDERFVSAYGFAVQPASIKVSIEKVTPRFSADLDTLAGFKREAIFIERTLALHGEEGEIFESNLVMPPGEELISVRNGDDSEPDWKATGAAIKIRWSEGLDSGKQRVFKIKSRMEPPKWPETDQVSLGDLKVQGAEKVNGYLALQPDKMFRVETANVDGLEKRDGRITPVKGDFAWFRREAFQLDLKLMRRAPEVQAVLLGYALPVDGALDIHGQLNFNIQYSGVNKLRIKVPAGSAEQFYFEGAQIAERNRDGDTWTIVMQKEITGDYALKFHAVIPFDESKSNFQVDMPSVEPLDVKQQAGTWAIEANTSTEITFKAAGMNELDPLHAPALADYKPRHQVIGVYGYLGRDHSLKLEGMKHEAAPILTAVVDKLDLDTIVSTSGAERHEALFFIRTVGDQFLDVTLPEGSSVWSLTVGGDALKPVSEKPDVVRVQLPATLDRTHATLVQLVYETRRHEWNSSGGYNLVAPRLDPRIPVLQSHWSVWLPDGFTYTALDSNLRKSGEIQQTTPLLFAPFTWFKKSAASAQPLQETAANAPQPPQLEKLFEEADALFAAGRYDLAYKRYEQVLEVDSGNQAARKGLAKVEAAKLNYNEQAYNTTRAILNERATAQWEIAPRKYDRNDVVRVGPGTAASSTEYIQEKLNRIIIPRIEFREATIREAIDFLKKRSVELDTTETDPARKGVNIVLKLDSTPGNPEPPAVTLSLTSIPLGVALDYITKLSNLRVKVDPYMVTIVPLAGDMESFATKEYSVPPELLRTANGAPETAREFLENAGVVFPPGASANYLPSSKKLIVRNSESNLDLVDEIVDAETAPTDENAGEALGRDDGVARANDIAKIRNKLDSIIIPKIDFREVTVREAIDFLKAKATEIDPSFGISLFLKLDAYEGNEANAAPNAAPVPGLEINANVSLTPNAPPISPAEAKITLSLTNVPLSVALDYVTKLANLKVKIEPYAVVILPLSEPTDTLITREYQVPPGFLSTGAAGMAGGNNMVSGLAHKASAREYLESAGVVFPAGASANFIPSGKLVVRNTEANLDVVDQLVGTNPGPEPVFDTRAPEALKAAGILPMKLELEHSGKQFTFDGFYAAESVSFHYLDWWSQARRMWIWWLAGVIAFFAASGFGVWRRAVWGALVLTFVPVCIAQSMTGMCNALLAGWLTGFVIYLIATRVVFRRRVTEAATV